MFVQYNENVTKYCAQKAWKFIFFIINKIILELSFHLPTYYYSFNCLLFTFRTKKYKIILKDWKMLFQSLVILMKLLQKSLLFQSFVILTELMLFSRTDADKVVAGKVTPTPPHPTGHLNVTHSLLLFTLNFYTREKGRARTTVSSRGEWPSSLQIWDKCDNFNLSVVWMTITWCFVFYMKMHVNTFIGLSISKYHLIKSWIVENCVQIFHCWLFSAWHIKENA